MASINSLGGASGMSSIYGNRNVLSGLASGMDTESMIENAVSGLKMKITGLQQKRTKTEWQQEALRSIIDKMANFTQKYTSYTSSTNLYSSSFFDSAVKTTASGTYSKLVSAVGKTTSSVKVLGVSQLASAATYRISGSDTFKGDGSIALTEMDLDKVVKSTSNATGRLTFSYGEDKTVAVELTEADLKDVKDADGLAEAINKKLGEDTPFTAKAENGTIKFYSGDAVDESVKISGAAGKIKDTLKIGEDATELTVGADTKLVNETTRAQELSGKEVSITLNGVTKKITLAEADENGKLDQQAFYDKLKKDVSDAFNGKVVFDTEKNAFRVADDQGDGNTLSISSSVGESLGFASSHETSYVNTGKRLGDLLKADWGAGEKIKAEGSDTSKFKEVEGEEGVFLDDKGNRVMKDDQGDFYRIGSDGAFLEQRVLTINDQDFTFTQDDTLEKVLTAINDNEKAGVTVSFSKLTNQFLFTAKESGSGGRIEFEGLGADLFGAGGKTGGTENAAGFVGGSDAKIKVDINGKPMELTRNDNTFDVDGMQLTVKGTFNEDYSQDEPVTFTSAADTDKIIGAIKEMAEDFNAMMSEIKTAYGTLPGQKSNGAPYEPLTDKDMEGMSESAIKAYEEKAKQGLLFADRDLASLYEGLRDAITPSGKDSSILRSIGIDTTYSEGRTTLTIDEDKLRAALESDPNQVRDAFIKRTSNGSDTDGLMQSMKNMLDRYGKLSSGSPGILVSRAGTPKLSATLNNNNIQKVLDNYNQQIDRLNEKITKQVDMYTRKFSQLEQLVAQMNSQSSALAGFMGG